MAHGRLFACLDRRRLSCAALDIGLALMIAMLLGLLGSGEALAMFPSCGTAVQSGANSVVTCAYTGGEQTWTVPNGVTSVVLDVKGAAGGAAAPGAGAPGGEESGTLAVTANEVLTITTGGMGADATGTGGTGGVGGGGGGGAGSTDGGAGGGGGSFVYDEAVALVLGAGGGGGSAPVSCTTGVTAGSGGGDTGGASACPTGGGGGTQIAPGTGGGDGATSATGPFGAPVPSDGGNGGTVGAYGGGGGGGGFWGGGGGGETGGGGGSGYMSSSITGGSKSTGVNSGNGVVTITYPTPTAPSITSANHATFTTGISGTFTVATTGVPAPSLSESGALPAGVSFTDKGDGTATLAGTPSGASGGVYPVTITASNGVPPNASQSFTLTVHQPPSITSANHATFTTGISGTFTVATTGVPAPSLSESGALPAGVSFTDKGDGTATLAGTPSGASGGVYPVTITASNGVPPNASQSFTLRVVAAPLAVALRTGRAFVSHARAKVSIACSGGAAGAVCTGRLSLTVRRRVVRHIHHRRKVSFKTIVLARAANYSVASGRAEVVALRLTAAGLRLLRRAPHHRLPVRAATTLAGGNGASSAIVLQLK